MTPCSIEQNFFFQILHTLLAPNVYGPRIVLLQYIFQYRSVICEGICCRRLYACAYVCLFRCECSVRVRVLVNATHFVCVCERRKHDISPQRQDYYSFSYICAYCLFGRVHTVMHTITDHSYKSTTPIHSNAAALLCDIFIIHWNFQLFAHLSVELIFDFQKCDVIANARAHNINIQATSSSRHLSAGLTLCDKATENKRNGLFFVCVAPLFDFVHVRLLRQNKYLLSFRLFLLYRTKRSGQTERTRNSGRM